MKTKNDSVRRCATCQTRFSSTISRRRKYCSEKCGELGRAVTRPCVVCHNNFIIPRKSPKQACSSACSRVLRDRQRSQYYETRSRESRRRRGDPIAVNQRVTHLDSFPNPFAGALSVQERAELRGRCNYIRSYITSHGGGMGEVLISGRERTKARTSRY